MIRALSLLVLLFSTGCMATFPADIWRLRYDERGLPLVDVQIASRLHTLMLDTGSGEGLHLYKFNLHRLIASQNLKATQQPPRKLLDVSGNENTVSVWKINRLLISGIPFKNVEAVSFSSWGWGTGADLPVSEVLGLGIFREHRVMMDFKRDRLQVLDKLPPDINSWSAFPVDLTSSGLRITALAGKKPLHLIIDTAASHSLLFGERLPAGILFSGCQTLEPDASNFDCRVTKIAVTDRAGRLRTDWAIVASGSSSQALDFDGLLGMRFMRGQRIILDMPGQMFYIEP